MRPRTALATTVLFCALTGPAHAATYQTGALDYRVAGSWTTTIKVQESCDVPIGPDKGRPTKFTYPVIEKGTFVTTKGTARYQGDVGRRMFFLGVGDRPAKLTARVTRTATRPVPCYDVPPQDCGTKTVSGIVRNEFGFPFGRRTLRYQLGFADSTRDSSLTDPFKSCGDGNGSLFLNGLEPVMQERALRYPTPAAFWGKKVRVMRGGGKVKNGSFTLRLKTTRRTLSSKNIRRPY